jgi:hypothetical protein
VMEEKEFYVLFWAQREHAIRILPKPIFEIGFRLENSVRQEMGSSEIRASRTNGPNESQVETREGQ